MSILDRMGAIDAASAVSFVLRCMNFDGGFGNVPGGESHAGQVFTCVGTLALLGRLELVQSDTLGWWLAERQTPSGEGLVGKLGRTAWRACSRHSNQEGPRTFSTVRARCSPPPKVPSPGTEPEQPGLPVCAGGLNGRPEKLQDVCYSWWCLSSLSCLGRLHWIDGPRLARFILECQDEGKPVPTILGRARPLCFPPCHEPSLHKHPGHNLRGWAGADSDFFWGVFPSSNAEHGGISDRPEDVADVYHTFFGLAGLALMGHPALQPIDPAYALPVQVVRRLPYWQRQSSAS